VQIIENEFNKGVDDNIVENVTKLIDQYGKIIVIEDDCFLSKYFLKYMNEALLMYENEERVMHVSGCCMPIDRELPSTFFLQSANGWGWGTWRRAWKYYEPDAKLLYNTIEENQLFFKFNYEGKLPENQKQLEACSNKLMNNWDIKWYASQFLKDGLCLQFYPSLVNNIGQDGSGEHSNDTTFYDVPIQDKYVPIKKIPVIENSAIRKAVSDYLFVKTLSFLATVKHVWIKKFFGLK